MAAIDVGDSRTRRFKLFYSLSTLIEMFEGSGNY